MKNAFRSREELLKRNEKENSESSEEICKNTEYNKTPRETHKIRKHTPY